MNISNQMIYIYKSKFSGVVCHWPLRFWSGQTEAITYITKTKTFWKGIIRLDFFIFFFLNLYENSLEMVYVINLV